MPICTLRNLIIHDFISGEAQVFTNAHLVQLT